MPRFIGPAVVTAVLLTLVPPVLARSGIGHAPGRAAERVEWRPPMRLPFGIDSEITPAQRVRPAVCFAPGTTEEVIRSYAGGDEESGTASAQFNLYSRWSATATDGCCLSQGDPTTITFSFVPDGTPIGGFAD